MRKLFLLRGMMGSGKSTFIRENNLVRKTISFDQFSEAVLNSRYDSFQDETIVNGTYFRKANQLIGKLFNEALYFKLEQGESFIIDFNGHRVSDLNGLKKKAELYGYDVSVLNFGLKELDYYLSVNHKREVFKQVPEEAIKFRHKIFSENESAIESEFNLVSKGDVVNYFLKTSDELAGENTITNDVFVVGDIHGCFNTLQKFIEQNNDGLFIFVGDYIDRGKHSGKVLQFVERHIDCENYVFLMGNHEQSLLKKLVAADKERKDMCEEEYGMSYERVLDVLLKLKNYYFFNKDGKNYFINHGGFNTVPKYPNFSHTSNYFSGSGEFKLGVDKLFEKQHNGDNWHQIHGHRNEKEFVCFGNLENKKSISLECKVEFGGNLPIVKLSKNKVTGFYINSDSKDVELDYFEFKKKLNKTNWENYEVFNRERNWAIK